MNARGREHGQVPGGVKGNKRIGNRAHATVNMTRRGTNYEGSQIDPGDTISVAGRAREAGVALEHFSAVIGRLRVLFSFR